MPTNEEDIAQISNIDKGKSKERQDHDLASTPGSSSERLNEVVYPPVSDDAEESRRVEENLRRWEVAERQRRKAARESQTSPGGGTSLVSDVTRRASLLFSGRKGKQHSISSLGNHAALRSRDSIDVVPLNQAPGHPLPPSPTEHENDPFANPQDIPLSPFDDAHATNKPSTQANQALLRERSSTSSLKEDTPHATDSRSFQRPPPVMPIDLPPPRSPPPVDTPPPPISPPTPSASAPIQPEENVRWWHDWLCGCSEGPDRGGEHQAGRTNPNE